ncbi:hypothetical protein SKAU_G00233840 [Synaphobranchus kaupii]|uniref:Uncharacterized protein n=1 Tax=Synaphobranchus kaupii TaxID=118154 RepID=A0A9Q1IRH6_SYNKA|nr:hypothetical protein SKAU_G00233840 [Synaphobranchus kaupii]
MAELCPAKEKETWSGVAGRNLTKETILPIFIMEREILSRDESIKNPVREEEIYHCLIQEVHPNHLSVVTEFLGQRGCKIVGNVMKRMIRYNNQLTNCSNGDRMVYIEAMPPKHIPRSVKMGTHWVKVFYNGQINLQQHGKPTHDSEHSPKYSPATEESIRVIEETYNKYVAKQPSPPTNVTEPSESEEGEPEMEEETASQTMAGKADESRGTETKSPTVAPNTTRKKRKQKKKIQEGSKRKGERQDTLKQDTMTNRQRSHSVGSTKEVDTSSIRSYFQPVKALQAKRSRENRSLSSESGTSSPAKKRVDTEDQDDTQHSSNPQLSLQVSTKPAAMQGMAGSSPGEEGMTGKGTQHEKSQKTSEKQSAHPVNSGGPCP